MTFRKPTWILIVMGFVLVAAGLVITTQTPSLAQDPNGTPNPVGEPPTFLLSYYEAWVGSAHADAAAAAFTNWDSEGEIPDRCARCHSTYGYLDYLGADGSAPGVVDAAAALGSVINCDACHSPEASTLTSITFPSGNVIEDTGNSTRCMVCHQGRSSTNAVNSALENAALADMNTVSDQLSFLNIHYYAAAASLYGSEAAGGYEYEGYAYQMKFEHVEGYDTCDDCHNPHTLELKTAECVVCHEGADSLEGVYAIRMPGSMIDFDGDGNVEEGIRDEIVTLQETLYAAIQAYANEVVGTAIAYDEHHHPYFFIDTNGNGVADEDEAVSANRYNAFTGNLLKAAYNYQVSKKDPGNFAHNAKYHIQLLHDSIMMLNANLADAIDVAQFHRNAPGHFDSSAEAFRHWDAEGEVPATCAKCHSAAGLPFFIKNNVNIAQEPSNSLACTTCHDAIPDFTVYTINEVTMPSGATVSFGEGDPNNVCLNCHQGRESTASVNAAIRASGVGDDEVGPRLGFRNIHYFVAGVTLFGNEAQGAYQYDGQDYSGRNPHVERRDACTECHNEHTLKVEVDLCVRCHEELEDSDDLRLIRLDEEYDPVDYNGNGDVTEPIAAEIGALHEALYAAIQAYAAETIGTPIVYVSFAYPYWYIDANANGVLDDGEVNSEGRYTTWTPSLVRAAYNYQYVAKDPGAFAHNPDYVLQILYDSIQAIGGDDAVAGFTRAPVR